MQVKKVLKTAVFTALALLVLSFTLNSCKVCDKTKKLRDPIDRSQTSTSPASDISKQQENQQLLPIARSMTPASDISKQQENLKKKQEEDNKRQEEAEHQRLAQKDERKGQEEGDSKGQEEGDSKKQEEAERERREKEECRKNVENKAGSAAAAAIDVVNLVDVVNSVVFERDSYHIAADASGPIFDLANEARSMYEGWQKCARSFNSAMMILDRKMKVNLHRAKASENAMNKAWSFDKIKSQVAVVGWSRGSKFGKALSKLSRLMREADIACNEFAVLYELEQEHRMLDHQDIINGIERILAPYKKKK